jgi:peptidoglycan L-alanyl-D-glutamate endopeptidase CwlK
MQNISQLHPILQRMVKDLISECHLNNIDIEITECLRTEEEQDKLYEAGLSTYKGSDYNNIHQWGIAFNFALRSENIDACNIDTTLDKIGEIGTDIGLDWYGNHKVNPTKFHFQLPDWGITSLRLRRISQTPENFFQTW